MLVGDSVLIEHGRTHGVVLEVSEDAAELKRWNLKEPGVLIKSPLFGLVFLPVSTFAEDPILFVSRDAL